MSTNEIILFVGDYQVDLIENNRVSQSFQAFDIGELKTRNANFTNKLIGAFTPNNARIFELAKNINSGTLKPYTKLSGKLISNGFETMSNAVVILTGISKSGYELEVYSGVFDLFDVIGEKKIAELDLHLYDTGSANNQIKTPYINIGLRAIDEDPDSTPTYTDPDGLLWPMYAFPYQILIEEIIKQAGYEKDGDIFSHPKFAAMHLAALGYEGYNERFTGPKEFEAIADGTQSIVSSGSYVKVQFNTLVSGNEAGYWNGSDTYAAGDPQDGLYGGAWYTFKAYAVINVTVTGAGSAEFNLFSNLTGVFPVSSYIMSAGTHDLIFEISSQTIGDISGILGSEVYLRMRASTGTPSIDVKTGSISVKANKTKAAAYLGAAGILPDMLQKDLMRDFLIRFALIPKELNGVIYFKSIDDIIKDKINFVDWSEKVNTESESLNFKLKDYAMNNYFKYSINEPLENELSSEGNLLINNNTVQVQKDIYESPFIATDTLKFGNDTDGHVWCAHIPIYKLNSDNEVEDDIGAPGLRLLLIRDAYDYESNATDKGYFHSGIDYSLNFQTFIDEFYPLLSLSLQKNKLKESEFNLNDFDITQLDFFKLVYENSNWYLLNKVNSYVPGFLTKVELFKVV